MEVQQFVKMFSGIRKQVERNAEWSGRDGRSYFDLPSGERVILSAEIEQEGQDYVCRVTATTLRFMQSAEERARSLADAREKVLDAWCSLATPFLM